MSETDEKNKGLGDSGLMQDPNRVISDARMLNRALRERWPIPSGGRDEVCANLLEAAKRKNRRAISAARCLANMDKLNQADEHADRAYQRIDEGKATELVQLSGVEIVVPGLPRITQN